MTTQTEALKLALDRAAPTSKGYVIVPDDAFQVIKEALAQPAVAGQHKQEPVAYTNGIDVILAKHWTADYQPEGWEPLGYTTPPQRPSRSDIKPLPDEAKAVIDAARAAMDDSVEAYDLEDNIIISSELAASLSLCLDKYDRAIEAALEAHKALAKQEQKGNQLSCYCPNCEILGRELARIEKQDQGEPVAHTAIFHCPNCEYPHRQVTHITGVAQPPWSPQRTWVGLTEDEINQAYADSYKGFPLHESIEAKLKEKNT